MYTTERKEAMHSQVAELHQQKSSVTKTEQYSESKSRSKQIVTSSSTSQQQETTQQQTMTSSSTSSQQIQQQQQQSSSSSTHKVVQQQSSEEQMTEWQKVAMKEKKHVVMESQASHFSKVR